MIPIIVDETTGLDRKDELIVGGVPIGRGVLRQQRWFVLKGENGREYPLEGQAAAYWPDGSIKWVHLCGLADLEGGRRNSFTLIPRVIEPDGTLSVEGDDGCITIKGGVLDVELRADADNVLAVSRGGKTPQQLLKRPGISGKLTYVSPDGRNPRSYPLRFVDPRVEVVVQTSNRVVARLGGKFLDDRGNSAAELILFVEVYRQSPEIRLEPVWIYLGKPREDLVKSLTLSAHVPLNADECRYGFSNDRGAGYWDVIQRIRNDERGGDGPRFPMARVVQLGSSFYRTEKLTFREDASWLKAVEGQRSQGWCHVADDRLAVTAGMRHFWEEYPHSLGIDCDEGTITFGLIPPEAKPLDLRRYSPMVYGEAVYESGGVHRFRSELHGAHGIAKSHELMLRFGEPDDVDVARHAIAFVHPARLMTLPEHFASTNVIGRIAPADASKNKDVEQTITAIADFLVREREVRGWYGLMNFGDVMSSYYSDIDRWAFDDGGYAWVNTESLPDYGLWISALRAARADWLDAAIAMSRHNRDVDTYHRGELTGCGSRHNVNHWGGPDKEWRVSMPLVRRLHYYVTADPWTAETIRNTVAVYQSYERTTSIAPGMTAAIAGIVVKWEMSNDPQDEKVLRNLADVYARAVRQDGRFTVEIHTDLATGEGYPVGDEPHEKTFFMNTFGGQHTLVELADLLEDDKLSDALVRHADYWYSLESPEVFPGKKRGGISAVIFFAHAYHRTRDRRYLEAIREGLDSIEFALAEVGGDGILEDPPHAVLPSLTRRNKVTCHGLGDVMHLTPYALAVLP